MPYSPISVRQINQLELSGFSYQILTLCTVRQTGNQLISGEKTFADVIIPIEGFQFEKKYVNGNYTVNPNDYFICVNTSGAPKTLTFTQTGFITGKEYRIKDFRGNSVSSPITLTGNGITFDYQPSVIINSSFAALHLVGGSGYNYEIN